jgi:hypothetical protein
MVLSPRPFVYKAPAADEKETEDLLDAATVA